ncbi:toprim domain-containing protein [Pseudonocardia alni]|uniref:toprim domain-containing protein n=1 Tax=Pseudonocardia alni TaxID=33907 RepID=UPI0033FB86B1
MRYDDASDQLLIDCPSHRSDSGTSLRAQYVDGRVLLHCFAGCETESVLGALGLSYRDLFDAPLPPGTVRGHTYADASGQLVGLQTKQPLPDGKKRFTPITRDPKTGAWRTRASDELKRTPYRLPEVLAAIAQGQPVWVVEGERDADSLWSHGVAATCNLNGAGKWNDAHARVLTGADVVVCQDYDEPGDKHRDAVFESLLDVAATVKLVRPAHGKDITDHLDAGYALA